MWPTVAGSLQGVGNFVVRWSVRLTKIFKHRLMTKRKNILVFADHDSKLYQEMYKSMKNHWEITRIYTGMSQNLTENDIKDQGIQGKEVEVSSGNTKPTFYSELRLNDNYEEIQRMLEGRQFDAVVVLPKENLSIDNFQFEDQSFAVDYLPAHQKELMRNVFSYRLASKYLTTSGVVILSGSQRDFIKAESEQIQKTIPSFETGKWRPSTELIDAQVTYLGVMIGERDHTDLNSWSLVAMSREWIPEDLEFVAKHYCTWASGQHLPMPGSFALFKRKAGSHRSAFLEYI